MTERPYRVVQWATGNIGLRSLRAVIEHPDLELVGLYVYSDAKVGQDAGVLCGLGPTGVVATRDAAAILALKPDCVLYMGDRADMDVVCSLLESGANVVATRSEFHDPDGLDADVRERIERACAQGGTSLYSTGSSPGFITEALPFALLSIQRRLDHLRIEEFADMSSRNSPEMIFDLMGFGRDPPCASTPGASRRTAAAHSPGRSGPWQGRSRFRSTTSWPPRRWRWPPRRSTSPQAVSSPARSRRSGSRCPACAEGVPY